MKLAHMPGHLLVVDDNKVNRLLLARSLEQQGHVVSMAVNGKQALEMLHGGQFDLVLLDIEMPELNGYQVLEACLQHAALRDMPIIMTSSLDELDSVVKCIEMGAEDYLTKPLNPILLRARVNASLEKKRLRDEQRKLFRTFATPEVAEELLEKGFTLGGKHVRATAMFADIRSFTTLAESQHPADTIELLNNYFALMFDAITSNGGMLNQMMGDGIMAVFGAPIFHEDHRTRAVRAALDMIETLELFNVEQARQNKVQIQIGIGIATGQMIAGYAGTQDRAFYTCIGDVVNLAARLESHTKVIGFPILIDQYTQEGLSDEIRTEGLGPARFKGKQQEVNVYSVVTK